MIGAQISERIAKCLARWFNIVAMAAVAAMLVTLVIDIIGTKLLRKPLPGSIDFIGLQLLLVGAFGIAQAEILRKHIRVDFVITRLPLRIQEIFSCISSLLGLGIFAMLIWSCLHYTIRLFHSGEGTLNLEVPLYPFPAILALACLPLLVVFVWEFIRSFTGEKKKWH